MNLRDEFVLQQVLRAGDRHHALPILVQAEVGQELKSEQE